MSDKPTALVTGGAQRLGKAVTLHLLEKGWRVAVQYRHSREEAEALRKAHPDDILLLRGELQEAGFCAQAVRQVSEKWGGLDLLVNSASLFTHQDFDKITATDFDLEYFVNVRAPFLLSQEMARVPGTGESGRLILHLSDASITRPQRGALVYLTSKSALTGMTRHLAAELAPHIRVNTLALGLMLPSPGEKISPTGKSLPLREYGGEVPLLAAVDYLLKDDFVTGTIVQIDGGRYA